MHVAFLFPGQGAQVQGMGKDFAESFSVAREVFEEGDALLGRNLSKIIFEGPLELLTETVNSQPAIFLTSIAILRVIEQQFPDLKPAVCAGLSLGEYTALCASGRIAFAPCLSLVNFRGECMHAACESTSGTMAAIMGLPAKEVRELVQNLGLPNDLWVANFNCPGQIVISGTLRGVELGMEAAKKRGAKRAIPLRVHGAFHSGLMRSAKDSLSERIAGTELSSSSIALAMNVAGGYVQDPHEIRHLLIEQVTSSVHWEETIRLLQKDADLFIEIGPGRTLTGFNRHMDVAQPTITVNKVADLEELYG